MYNLNWIIVIVFNYTYAYAWDYKLVFIYIYINSQRSKKIQLDFYWILNFSPHVPFNFVPSELFNAKIEDSKSN